MHRKRRRKEDPVLPSNQLPDSYEPVPLSTGDDPPPRQKRIKQPPAVYIPEEETISTPPVSQPVSIPDIPNTQIPDVDNPDSDADFEPNINYNVHTHDFRATKVQCKDSPRNPGLQ